MPPLIKSNKKSVTPKEIIKKEEVNLDEDFENMSSNNQQQFLDIKRENLEHHVKYFKLAQEVLVSNASIKNDTHTIKEHQSKHNMIVMGIVLICGIILGMNVSTWTPIINDAYNTFKFAKSIKG